MPGTSKNIEIQQPTEETPAKNIDKSKISPEIKGDQQIELQVNALDSKVNDTINIAQTKAELWEHKWEVANNFVDRAKATWWKIRDWTKDNWWLALAWVWVWWWLKKWLRDKDKETSESKETPSSTVSKESQNNDGKDITVNVDTKTKKNWLPNSWKL